jgi:hypothetical protein
MILLGPSMIIKVDKNKSSHNKYYADISRSSGSVGSIACHTGRPFFTAIKTETPEEIMNLKKQ